MAGALQRSCHFSLYEVHDAALRQAAALLFHLRHVELVVGAAVREELSMAACLDDVPVVDDDDGVAVLDGAEAVGDHEHGASRGDLREVLHDDVLALVVERARGFVEDEDARIEDEGARDGDALPLAAGEEAAALADEGVVLLREFLDEGVGAGEVRGGGDLFVGGVGAGDLDVLLDGAAEEHAVLEDDADLAAEPGWLYLRDVDAVDEDAAALGEVEALDELGEGGFAGAGAADDADLGARRDAEAEAFEDVAAVRRVAECDVLEGDVALERGQRGAAGVEGRLGLFVHDVAEAVHGDARLLEVLPHVDEAHDGGDELARHHLERDEFADGDGLFHDAGGADPEDGEVEDLLEEEADGAGDVGDVDDGEYGADVARENLLVALDEVLLDACRLDGVDARDGLDEEGAVLGADEEAVVDEALVDRRDDEVQEDEERQHDEHDEGEQAAVVDHDAEVDGGEDDVEDDGERGACDEVPEVLKLADARDDVADLPFVEILDGQRGDGAEEVRGEDDVHLARDVGEEVAAHGLQPVGEDGAENHAGDEDVEGVGAPVDEDLVDDDLREERRGEAEELEQEGEAEDGAEVVLVFPNDGEEPAKAEFPRLGGELEAAREEDDLAAPVGEDFRAVGLYGPHGEARVEDVHVAVAHARDDDVVALLHADDGRVDHVAEPLGADVLIGADLEPELARRTHERRGVYGAFLKDVGALELTHVGRYLVVFGDDGEAGEAGVDSILHVISPSVIRSCSGGRGRGRSR